MPPTDAQIAQAIEDNLEEIMEIVALEVDENIIFPPHSTPEQCIAIRNGVVAGIIAALQGEDV